MWSGTDIGTGDHNLTVTSIVQEIVDQGGWASGNAMALLLYGVAASLRITSYNTSTTLCARLAIDYTEGGGGGGGITTVSYTHLRAHETVLDLVCRLLLEKKNKTIQKLQPLDDTMTY